MNGQQEQQQTHMARQLYSMGRTDFTDTMHDRQMTPNVVEVESTTGIVKISLPELTQHFSRTGMESSLVQYQLKSLKFPNDQYQVFPGDYIEIRAKAMYYQATYDAGSKGFITWRDGLSKPTDYDSIMIVDELSAQRFIDNPVKMMLDVQEPLVVTAEQFVSILNSSVRNMLIELTRDPQINVFESELTRYLDNIGIQRVEGRDYAMSLAMKTNLDPAFQGHAIKINVGNIFRNAQFVFDGSSGRIKLEWIYPADGKHVAFMGSETYDGSVNCITKWDGFKQLDQLHERPTIWNGGTWLSSNIPTPIDNEQVTLFPSGKFTQSGVENTIEHETLQFYIELKIGSNLTPKRREILSNCMGMHWPEITSPLGTSYGWKIYDRNMQMKSAKRYADKVRSTLGPNDYDWAGYSPRLCDMVPLKELYIQSNLSCLRWDDNGRKTSHIAIVHISTSQTEIPQEREFVGDTYRTNEEISSLRNIEIVLRDKWGDVVEFIRPFFMELAIFMK